MLGLGFRYSAVLVGDGQAESNIGLAQMEGKDIMRHASSGVKGLPLNILSNLEGDRSLPIIYHSKKSAERTFCCDNVFCEVKPNERFSGSSPPPHLSQGLNYRDSQAYLMDDCSGS